MPKGQKTQEAILDQALDLSTEIGLEGLSIGALAKRVGMSKSGLYAHFASKEELQVQILDAAALRVAEVVVAPALKQSRGLPRLRTLFDNWLDWSTIEFSGGCPFMSGAVEFDDRPGPVRECLVTHFQNLLDVIARAARISVEEGHLREGLDDEQFAYEFWGILLSYNHYARLMKRMDARRRATEAFINLIRMSGTA